MTHSPVNLRGDADTRARCLRAALELYAADGYAATSFEAIARAAGTSVDSLHQHFASKSTLLQAIFAQSLTDVHAAFAAADTETNPHDRLPALLRSTAAIAPRYRDFWAIWYGLRMQREVLESLRPSIIEFMDIVVGKLERHLGDIGWPDPATEAQLLFAQIDGMCQHYMIDPERYPLHGVVERMISRYSNAWDVAPARPSKRH